MKSRHYVPSDYETFAKWCEGHKMPAPPKTVLPPCGVVIEDDAGIPVSMGFLYMSVGVGVAWLAWATTSTKLAPWRSIAALEYLVRASEAVCAASDYGVLFTMTDREGLSSFFKRQGFTANHTGATQFFKEVNRGS